MSEKNSLAVQVILLVIIGTLIIGGLLSFTFFPERNGVLAYCSGMAALCFTGLTQIQKIQSDRVQRATYLLGNSHYGMSLYETMTAKADLADKTKEPAHIEAAVVAREKYEDHQRKQRKVDEGEVLEP